MKTSTLVGIFLAMLLIGLSFRTDAGAYNSCPGHSCDPLPPQAQACDGPAAEHNPHCGHDVVTEVPAPTATSTPTSTSSPTAIPTQKTPEPSALVCPNGQCPDPACSLATIAAGHATESSVQVELLHLQLTQMAP